MKNIKDNNCIRSDFINDLVTPDNFKTGISGIIFLKWIFGVFVGHKTQIFCQIPDLIAYLSSLVGGFSLFDVGENSA